MAPDEILEQYASGKRDFSGANLSGTCLYGADLRGANLRKTCLDPNNVITPDESAILAAGMTIEDGYVHGWRTAKSQHCGAQEYAPGGHYVAPYFSTDTATACHPGIYLHGKKWVQDEYPNEPLVAVRSLLAETVHASGKFRAKQIWGEEAL